ncbi:MAG TPA: ABC transporter permease [Vicinamibacterales bacterium]|nr:ABC transporter permease [Vicinamibacterales bacterium]
MKDVAHSFRILLRHPRYAVLAILTLAAGIGVTASMFGLLDALFFRPLPLADPNRLVDLSLVSPTNRFGMFSYEEFRDIEREAPGFKDVMAIGQRGVTLNRNGEVSRLLIHYVSGRYFPSLGIPMYLGRGFAADDDRPELTTPQVVINHHLWQQELGSPPDIIGRTIQLNNTHFTVIGVTAPGFVGLKRPLRTDVWVTTAQAPFVVPGLREEITNRQQRWFRIIGRLADGADPAQVRAGLDVIVARWRGADARDYADAKIVVASEDLARRQAMLQGALFLGLVGLVLLIACANVANLTLARGEERHRELALRSALGATRARLLRQMLVESAMVSAAATVAGVMLAVWLVRLFPTLLPPDTSAIMLDIRIDGRFLAFASVLGVLSTTLVGLLPAWRGSRTDITTALKAQAIPRTAGGVQLRDLLVVSEIALSGVIVIAAGLLLRSFVATLSVNPGFDTRKNVATFYVVPGLKGYDSSATYRFMEAARRSAATVTGVKRASYGIRLPAQGNEAGWASSFTIPGKEPPPGKDAFEIRYTMVGPEYFEVMGTRILTGRGIEDSDLPDSAPVAIISDTMARRLWPGESPIGRRIRMGRARPVEREIVGVAEDIRISGLYEPPEMYVYVPYAQQRQSFGLLLVETEGDVAGVIAPVKQRIAAIDANVPVLTVSSMANHMDLLLYDDRRNAWIGLAVALLALTLGAVGVYGVVSLVTARRTKEIGIRVALGAERRQLLRLLLGKGFVLASTGAVLGVAGGLLVGRELRSQLHDISPADPWSVAAGTAVLVSVALASSLIPAWRASRVDPAVALREQ